MNLQEYASYDGLGLAKLVKTKQVTPQELTKLALQGIEKVNPSTAWETIRRICSMERL
ncbi:hypothetical protein ACQKOF_06390 [Lysinibacillus sp. NPDC093190]|uniref:hypothetical protein n=1 Tax=Lysinibacillus sp. NPDC093190 TaxID=3390575 RepID=UPI003D0203D7